MLPTLHHLMPCPLINVTGKVTFASKKSTCTVIKCLRCTEPAWLSNQAEAMLIKYKNRPFVPNVLRLNKSCIIRKYSNINNVNYIH